MGRHCLERGNCEILVSPSALDSTLQEFVSRTATAFGRNPIDDFVGVHDVAGLAMDAVGEVDLQTAAVSVLHHFVNGGGAEILAGVALLVRTARMTNIRLQDVKVAGLVFIVGCTGMVYIGQFVER
jgi:hypothetical protein